MKTLPLIQQTAALDACAGRSFFAYLMEQGTGKSWVALAESERLFSESKITTLCVVAQNGVHLNWIINEVPEHLATPCEPLVWTNNHTKRFLTNLSTFLSYQGPKLRIIAFNIESFSLDAAKAFKILLTILQQGRAMLVLDESDMIKSPTANRTRQLSRLAPLATYRRILTGTFIAESPFDAYSQLRWLSMSILPFSNYTTFKAYYAIWKQRYVRDAQNPLRQRKFLELVRYRNLPHLKRIIDAHSYTILKKDCLDLPEKVYERRLVLLPSAHAAVYNTVKQSIIAQLALGKITLAHAFTKLTRLCQITGGFIQYDDSPSLTPIYPNPKLESLLQLLATFALSTKVIIWARFVPELLAIRSKLPVAQTVCYYGEIPKDQRPALILKFQTDPSVRYFLGTQAAGSRGITLTAATQVIYYSNSFSLRHRLQSEDRAHRIGQHNTVTYTDLIAHNTLDVKIMAALHAKLSIASLFKQSPGVWLSEQ